MTKKIKVPKLRFPEFSEEWQDGKIEDNFQIRMCKRIFSSDTSTNGEIPFYKIGTIGKHPDSYISRKLFEEYKSKYNYPKKGELMITCSGTVGKTIVFDGKESYFQDSNIVWLDNQKSNINNNFLYYIISNFDWGKLNSTTIKRIYNDDLRKLKFLFPSLPEQQKIASFLSSVDEKIELTKKEKKNLEEYKKGIYQKIFSREIRFKDENGEEFGKWVEKKIGEIIIKQKKTNRLSSEGKEKGLYVFFNNSTKASNRFIDDFDYNGEMIIANTGGEAYFDYYNGRFGVMSDCFVFSTKQNVKFLYFFLKKEEKRINKIGFSGSGIKHLNKEYFGKIRINLPSTLEQEKIADFLSGIDEKIEKVNLEIEKMEKFKKGLLQSMFV